MARKLAKEFSFFDGAVSPSSELFFAIADDEAVSNKIPQCVIVGWRGSTYFTNSDVLDWRAVGIAVLEKPTIRIIAIGEYGQTWILSGGAISTENQLRGRMARKGPLRRARNVCGTLYAVGMGGQAYVRTLPSAWADITPTLTGTGPQQKLTGFEDVDGYSSTEIYAVGWEGEIWSFDGTNWTRRPSPTNMVLTCACCAHDGLVYTAGRLGLLLRGRHDRWEIVDQDVITDDIWGLCSYKDTLYVSTMTSLFRMENGRITKVQFDGDVPETCFRVSANAEALCSIGAKDVMLFDGQRWNRIE